MELKLVWTFCSTLFYIHHTCGHENHYNAERIMNGIDVSEHIPWVAAIVQQGYNFITKQYDNKFDQTCGGAIISHRFILTAAHCVFYKVEEKSSLCPWKFFMKPPSCLAVVVGFYNLVQTRPEDLVPVKRIISHSQYTQCTAQNDIALIELQQPLSFRQYVIPIFHEWIHPGQQAEIAGWGNRCNEEANKRRNSLSYTQVVVQSINHCSKLTLDKPHNTMLCARAGNSSIQAGDSGSGLWIYRNGEPHLIGLVSMAVFCSPQHCGALYTRLNHYKTWIHHGMRGHLNRCQYDS